MPNRGDVVTVNFAPTNPNAKIRPALVVQNDRDNARMQNTIVIQFTSNTTRAQQDTQLLVDHSHPDWHASGLRRASVANCSNIYTIHQSDITRTIGSLSPQTMLQVDGCLKAALGIF